MCERKCVFVCVCVDYQAHMKCPACVRFPSSFSRQKISVFLFSADKHQRIIPRRRSPDEAHERVTETFADHVFLPPARKQEVTPT